MNRFQQAIGLITEESQTFYHITPTVNIPEIRKHGLLPRIGEMSSDLGETTPAVYLFKTRDDVENALLNWMGEYYEDNDVDLSLITLKLPDHIKPNSVAFEYQVYDTIPPECIIDIKHGY